MTEQSPNNFSAFTPDNSSDGFSNPATPGVAVSSRPDNSANPQESFS